MRLWQGGLATLGAIVLLVFWAAAAMNYGDDVAVGKYRFSDGQESCRLVIKGDHTFDQTLSSGGHEQHAQGTWRRFGEGGVAFSKAFIVLRGDEPAPDGNTYAELHKALGLIPSLRVTQYFVLWYGKTTSGPDVAGTYAGNEPNVASSLSLGEDGSFTQTVGAHQVSVHAHGKWMQEQNGTVRFSRDFLKDDGKALDNNERASSMDPKGSNLQIEITKAEDVPQPVFRRSFFR